jgi:hypothetical protein
MPVALGGHLLLAPASIAARAVAGRPSQAASA